MNHHNLLCFIIMNYVYIYSYKIHDRHHDELTFQN